MEAIRIVDVGFDSSLCEMLGSYRGVPTSIRHGLRGYLTTVTMYIKGITRVYIQQKITQMKRKDFIETID
jgi:hypothetical protein